MSETFPAEPADAPTTTPPAQSESPLPQVFRSAVDWWVAALLVFPVLMAAAMGVVLMLSGRPGDASTMFLASVAALLVTAVFVVPCRYTFLKDALSIRCGLICYQIPYEAIRDVKRSSTLRSSPALSISRVAIQTERREHIVSPVQRERFIDQLRSRMPV